MKFKVNYSFCLTFLFFLVLSISVFAHFEMPRKDPEVPWEDDPQIEKIQDPKLRQLWEQIVIEYRRSTPNGSDAKNMAEDSFFKKRKIDAKDCEYLIESLNRELHREVLDWNCIYAVLVMMGNCRDGDAIVVDLMRYVLKLPRPIKLNDYCAFSYLQVFSILVNQSSYESSILLYDALIREFWGNDPMHSRKMLAERNTEENITNLRCYALSHLIKKESPEMAISLLDQFLNTYPCLPEDDTSKEAEFRRYVRGILERMKKENS